MGTKGTASNRLAQDGQKVIAILQRGWIFVGDYSQTGDIARLENASCIRRWGTKNGIGELALNGPLSENAPNGPTILDPCPPVMFHVREAVAVMETNPTAWE